MDGAEVSSFDSLSSFLAIVAFAVGYVAFLVDAMHQNLRRMSDSPLIGQHRCQSIFRQGTLPLHETRPR
jgi:hypothetical protein